MLPDSNQDTDSINKPLTYSMTAAMVLSILMGIYLLQQNLTVSPTIVDIEVATIVRLAEPAKERLELPYPEVVESDIADRSLPAYVSRHWLSEIDEELYTLQILGSHSRDQINRFLLGLVNQDEYAWFESRFRQQKWYVVVKGIFPDQQSAIKAVSET